MIQARHGFRVVIEDVRTRFNHTADGFAISQKVGGQDFHLRPREFTDGQHRAIPVISTAIRKVIAGDRCEYYVLQAQTHGSFSDTFRFVDFQAFGLAFRHGTESTRARADVAADHECGCFLRPAFRAIWALGTFADGFQTQVRNHVTSVSHARLRQWTLEPSRQAALRRVGPKHRVERHDVQWRNVQSCSMQRRVISRLIEDRQTCHGSGSEFVSEKDDRCADDSQDSPVVYTSAESKPIEPAASVSAGLVRH